MFSIVSASQRNQSNLLKELLKGGDDVNLFENGRSALHAACESGAKESVEILIQNKADLNLQDHSKGSTALHYCATNGFLEIAELILENSGKTNVADKFGNEALWPAVFGVKGNTERLRMVELFMKHGADKHHKNEAGKSPLDFAMQVNYDPLTDLLSK
jgi:ankyrin repeat protein